ncbi:MAG: phosphoglycerate dehydrogenase [Myxococcales bacterium]|nr:phosphoglycerate dehydrogenase [Myxococcales bacterium]
MPKVLISDKMSPQAADVFRQRGLDVDVITGQTPEALAEIIGQYDGLAVRSATKLTKKLIQVASNLKVVGRAGIGTDNIDKQAATQRGIVVMNTPFGNSITTAEHALSMMMACARDIPQANQSTHAGKWEKSKFMGVELMGKILGVIGVGNIGSAVCERALGLKMKVIGFDPFLSLERAKSLGIEKVELKELFARSNFITLHTPLIEQTRNIINAKAIDMMKDGVRIINCARGGLVDEQALRTALDSGKVAGAAVDVFASEPAKENILFDSPKCICTPHLGASTIEAQEKVAIQVAEQMSDFLLTGAVTNALNVPSLSADEAPKLRPYIALVELLGSFAGQVIQSEIREVIVEYQGDVAELNLKPITAAALTGLLTPQLESVNMVSAPAIAKERDIKLSEIRSEQSPEFHNLVRLTVVSRESRFCASGTLMSHRMPRIVEINEIAVEAELAPNMLFVKNRDRIGFIGSLGSALEKAGLNIATMHLGRKAPGEQALCLIQVDNPISAAIVKSIRELPDILEATSLRF